MMKTFCNLCRKPRIIKNKYVSSLIGTIFVYLAISFMLPISNFAVYITSNIYHSGQTFVSMHYGTYFSPIFSISMNLAGSLGGILEPKIGFMATTLLGLVIVVIDNIFFFKVSNIYLCYFLIIIMGIGAGIAISLLQKNLTFYNPKKKGRISGLLGILLVVTAAIFAFTGEKVINPIPSDIDPETEVYPKEVASNTYLYFMSGFFVTPIMGILGYLFLYEYKKEEDLNLSADNSTVQKELYAIDENTNINTNKNEEPKADLNPKTPEELEKEQADKNFEKEIEKLKQKSHVKKVIKTVRFWRISFAILLLNFPVMFMINTGRIFGAIIGINAAALQVMTLFQAVGILIFAPLFGYISDKTNPLVLIRIVTLVCILPGIILILFLENTFAFLVAVILYIFGLIGKLVGATPLTMEIYGIQESVILSSVTSTISKVGEIITTTTAFVVSFIYPGNSIRIPYKIIYVLSSLFSYASFSLLMIEDIDKHQYDDSDVNIDVEKTDISRDSLLNKI